MSEAEEKPGTDAKSEFTAGNLSPSSTQAQGGTPTTSSGASPKPVATSATEDEDESEDESEILEESPCGRWQKRREEVIICSTSHPSPLIHPFKRTLRFQLKFGFD